MKTISETQSLELVAYITNSLMHRRNRWTKLAGLWSSLHTNYSLELLPAARLDSEQPQLFSRSRGRPYSDYQFYASQEFYG